MPLNLTCLCILSIHDLTRRSTLLALHLYNLYLAFNSRPHKEVDWTWCLAEGALIFQFTTSQGGRPVSSDQNGLESVFQFTTSQGGRLIADFARLTTVPFNSRPHTEVDKKAVRAIKPIDVLSIHDLTRRSTPSTNHAPKTT